MVRQMTDYDQVHPDNLESGEPIWPVVLVGGIDPQRSMSPVYGYRALVAWVRAANLSHTDAPFGLVLDVEGMPRVVPILEEDLE